MLKTIRELLFGKPSGVGTGEDPTTVTVDVVEKKPEWRPGEPVENMVRAFEKNHRRFAVKREKVGGMFGRTSWAITDRVNGEVFEFAVSYRCHESWYVKPDWMSEAECKWGYREIDRIRSDRQLRLIELRMKRRQRLKDRERQRIIELYKGD